MPFEACSARELVFSYASVILFLYSEDGMHVTSRMVPGAEAADKYRRGKSLNMGKDRRLFTG